MNAIVIDAQMVVPLPAYRVAIAQWVSELKPPREWGYDPFKNFSDLIPSVTKARHSHLCEIVEIVAHGTPTYHGDIGEPTVASVAAKLRPMLDLHPVPAVYLTGCNTGLRFDGYCIAEALARALCGVTVYGAAGFIVSGSAATADAETDVTYDGETYLTSRKALHPHCWNKFNFQCPDPAVVARRAAARAEQHVWDRNRKALEAAIVRAISSDAFSGFVPQLLIGSDVRGEIIRDGVAIPYEVLLRGKYVRNARTQEVFTLDGGRELLNDRPQAN